MLKNSKRRTQSTSESFFNEAEFVSPSAQDDSPDGDNIVISTMHANQPNPLPSGDNANIIQCFRRIAQTTGQLTQVMNFPPIDHDSTIRYVPGIFAIFVKFPLIYGTHCVSLIRYVPGKFTNSVKFPDMTHTKNTTNN